MVTIKLIEEMNAEELRAELLQVHVYNTALQEQRARAHEEFHTLFYKWKKGVVIEKDWVPLMALVY